MKWKDVLKEDPLRDEEILFMTGDEEIHIGQIFDNKEIKKCKFYSFVGHCDYDCNPKTEFLDRVIYWHPVPEKPKKKK